MDGPKARDQATSIKTASLKSIQVRNYISQAPEDVPNVIEKFSRRVDSASFIHSPASRSHSALSIRSVALSA